MFARTTLRIVAALTALLASLAASAAAASAVLLPEPPAVPSPAPTPAPAASVPAVEPTSSSVVILGMDWQLALAAALFVLAVAFLAATVVQRRHTAHA